MSRDQRPRRAVVIDNGPLDTPARRADDAAPAGVGTDAVETAPPAAGWTTMMMWSILFLVACAAGAAGVALMLVAR